jgi:hypothetical protein
MGDPAIELATLMGAFRTTVGKTDPMSLNQAAIPGFVILADSMFNSLRATKSRLDARIAANEIRERELARVEAELSSELAARSKQAATSAACLETATGYLRHSDAEMATLSNLAINFVAKAGYEFEEKLNNMNTATRARERGFSASIAFDVTNTLVRPGVSARSQGVAAGAGMKTTMTSSSNFLLTKNSNSNNTTSDVPPPSPMRKKDVLAKHPALKDGFGFTK